MAGEVDDKKRWFGISFVIERAVKTAQGSARFKGAIRE
jgi:hypothetical protein